MDDTEHQTSAVSRCRFCGEVLRQSLVDLGMSPLCESYVRADQLNRMEPFYPLHVRVCGQCYLVQLDEYVKPEEIFSEYAYFSSYSSSWLAHAERYVDMIVARLGLSPASYVVELASNDGYLLKNFVRLGIPCLGIEPAANVARAAIEQGVPTEVEFFGVESARRIVQRGRKADLVIGNNVLAQVPELNDFVGGISLLLAPEGVVTAEFPHLLRLMEENQYDTIYHEHFSYFSLITAEKIFARHGMRLVDVEELPTHGGSLRVYACREENVNQAAGPRVGALKEAERAAGLDQMTAYADFGERVKESKRSLLEFLIRVRRDGKAVAGYGAAGKGNTLLNYCGIRTDFLDFVVDRNPYKHGRFLPGTHIPIYPPEKIDHTRPDFVLILPWNLREEIMKQMGHIRTWGGRFVIPIPRVKIFD